MPHRVQHLVVDANAFINSAPIREIGENVYTIQEVIDEVKCKRQLRQFAVLTYDLAVKEVFTENIKFVTEFSKKTGDYPSLSAIDIKVIALTYQLEKEKVGTSHLNTTPKIQKDISTFKAKPNEAKHAIGFFLPIEKNAKSQSENENIQENQDDSLNSKANRNCNENSEETQSDDEEKDDYDDNVNVECVDLESKLATLKVENEDDILVPVKNENNESENISHVYSEDDEDCNEYDEDVDDEEDEDECDDEWITVDNLQEMKKKLDDGMYSDDTSVVSCITADFAMQNVLKQLGLNVRSYDGKLIRKVRTFILRCTTCFKTTSVMTKHFCPNCGHASLKKVSVSLDENGKQQIFINLRRPLTSRGKRFSLPAPRGGQHAQNPILNADQAFPRSRPTKLARTKNNPLNDDYIAGYSPFVMRDVNSKSAVLGIRNNKEVKYWMRKNPK